MRLLPRLPTARRKPDRVRDALLVLVLIAAVAAGWFGWSWWSAAHDDGLARARERDSVLRQAKEALVTLNTVDYRSAKQDLAAWAKVTAGNLGSELAGGRKDQLRQVKKSKTVATATVRSAAVTELQSRKGTARVMAVLDIEIRGQKQQPKNRHSLLEVELTDTKNGWKVSSVQAAR